MEGSFDQKSETNVSAFTKAVASLRRSSKEKTAKVVSSFIGLFAVGCIATSFVAESTGATNFLATPNYRATMAVAVESTLEAPNSYNLEKLPKPSLDSSVWFSAHQGPEQGPSFSGTLVRATEIDGDVIASFITAGHGVKKLNDLTAGYTFEIRAPQFTDDPYASVGSDTVTTRILGDVENPEKGMPKNDIGAISVRMPKWMYDGMHLVPATNLSTGDHLAAGTNIYSLSYPKLAWIQGYEYFMTTGTLAANSSQDGFIIENAVADGGSSGGGVFSENGEWLGLIPGAPTNSSEYIFLASEDEANLQELVDSTEQSLIKRYN